MVRVSRFFLHTMPGLGEIAAEEARERLAGASCEGVHTLRGKNSLVVLRFEGDVDDLLALRTVEDVFALVERRRLPWGREGLTELHDELAGHRQLALALDLATASAHRRRGQPRTLRIIARMGGSRQPYRRVDMQRAVAHAVRVNLGRRVKIVEEDADAELWVNLVGRDLLCGVRLSDARMRHRDYKQRHMEASLRPSVAAAMVWLTRPRPDDVFLDPFCGAGTLVLERAMVARHRLLLASDVSSEALQATLDNMGRKHKPRALLLVDAAHLALCSSSVSVVAANLPFGQKVGSPAGNERLYSAFTQELARVLVPGGRAVLLTSEGALLRAAIKAAPELALRRRVAVTILGREAAIYLLSRE